MTQAMPRFALNHMATPSLDTRSFLALAARLGCSGVELRNDLADKKLADRAFFDGEEPAAIGAATRAAGLRLLGLSEVYAFNTWTPAIAAKVALLVRQARESGAESISLIPRNDHWDAGTAERARALRRSLGEILPMLEEADLVGLVEPLGFLSSSLRHKAEALDAIAAVGGEHRFRLVHDTFHHHLAGETEFFAQMTGIVHISGVTDPDLAPEHMTDAHRIMVDERDRLGNLEQIRALLAAGYCGAFSYEPFSPDVHGHADPERALAASMDFIRSRI